jgi:hypothetical protein
MLGRVSTARNREQLGSSHLRVEDAGGRLDNAGGAAVRLDLEDLAILVGEDSEELHNGVLGHHVEGEGVRDSVLLAGRDLNTVTSRRQVAEDRGGLGGALRKRLGRLEQATNEGNLNWAILVVRDVNQRLGDTAVDELNSEDVGIGEGRLDVDLEIGGTNGGHGLSLFLSVSDWFAKGSERSAAGATEHTSAARAEATRKARSDRADHLKFTILPETKKRSRWTGGEELGIDVKIPRASQGG